MEREIKAVYPYQAFQAEAKGQNRKGQESFSAKFQALKSLATKGKDGKGRESDSAKFQAFSSIHIHVRHGKRSTDHGARKAPLFP